MLTPQQILNAVAAGESIDWEFKSAKGGIPRNLWETYSAMANTEGGTILLGIVGDHDDYVVEGLAKPQQSLKTIWDSLNNRGQVSEHLLRDDQVRIAQIDGKSIVVMEVPRAGRRQRPVFVGLNPMTGTFRRNYEGDYHCGQDEVARMLSDKSLEAADSRILPHFTIKDLDPVSLKQYRNRFRSRNPDHVWLNEDDQTFLQKLGGWRKDRTSGDEGVTVAGLLMFGAEDGLNDPANGLKYHVDYRERPTRSIADRWTDRLIPDGTWVPNLFQFLQRVFPKLTVSVKKPFSYLDPATVPYPDPVRSDQSPVHEAIQEALVNSLIHADYRGIGGIVIEKFGDRIELSNPGSLLVSLEQIRQGAVSECRNPTLQKMFQMIGAGDRAGSGIDKIRRGWETQHWQSPSFLETTQPDRVYFALPMVSLLPTESVSRLEHLIGDRFAGLSPLEVQALVMAESQGQVANAPLRTITDRHSADLTQVLQGLVQKGLLIQQGQKRGASYRLPDSLMKSANGGSSPANGGSSPANGGSSPANGGSSPVESDPKLLEIAKPARERQRLPKEKLKALILELCQRRYLTNSALAKLLDRNPIKLRDRTISSLCTEGLLTLRYPQEPNHPDQAYTTRVNP